MSPAPCSLGRRRRRFVSSAPADLAWQTNRVTLWFAWDDANGEQRGDFEGTPLKAASPELVVVCRRAG